MNDAAYTRPIRAVHNEEWDGDTVNLEQHDAAIHTNYFELSRRRQAVAHPDEPWRLVGASRKAASRE